MKIDTASVHEEERTFLEKHVVAAPTADTEQYLLRRQDDILMISDGDTSFAIDFMQGKTGYRLKQGNEGKRSPLARACGIHKHGPSTILDATAGLGEDAMVLALTGSTMTLFERSPLLYLLLTDALRRASRIDHLSDAVSRITLHFGDSTETLQQLVPQERPEVCYLDPMFSPRTKKALVKKDLRIVRGLVGADTDADALLDTALECATRQVVVKRIHGAAPLLDKTPHHVVKGRTIRYDVYMIN